MRALASCFSLAAEEKDGDNRGMDRSLVKEFILFTIFYSFLVGVAVFALTGLAVLLAQIA